MSTMRAVSPGSFTLSLLLHGSVAALLALMAYVVSQNAEKPPVTFELVAGPPTDPGALVAPALGSPTGQEKLKIPETQPLAEPEPKEAAVQTAKVVPEVVVPPEPAPTKAKTKAEPVAKATAAASSQKMTKAEFEKRFPKPSPAPARQSSQSATKAPRIDAKGIAEGVRGGSASNTRGGGGGKALSRDQMDAMAEYNAALLVRLKQAHEPPAGVSDQLTAVVKFFLAANGQIDNVSISRSSGDPEFDRSVLAAFHRISWPGPRPDRQSGYLLVTFRMRED